MLVEALSTGQAEVDEAQKPMLHGHPSKQRIFLVGKRGRAAQNGSKLADVGPKLA